MTPLIHQARLHRSGQYFRPIFLEDKRKTSPNDEDRAEGDHKMHSVSSPA